MPAREGKNKDSRRTSASSPVSKLPRLLKANTEDYESQSSTLNDTSAQVSIEHDAEENGDDSAPDDEEDSGSNSDGEQDESPTVRPFSTSRSRSQLVRYPAAALFPPFYNKPPTPLPPSPSLTSLFRPSFSTSASRARTPDSSDADRGRTLPADANTSSTSTRTSSAVNLPSITASARHAPPVPRATPKVPTYEYYGFAMYVGSSAAFLMYVLWAYVPAPLLHQMGIHYYPNRWWALAVPCWLVALVIYIYIALASYNTRYLTLPLDSCENLVDATAQIAVIDRRTGKIVRDAKKVQDALRRTRDADGDARLAMRGNPRLAFANALDDYQFGAADEVDWGAFWAQGTDAVMDVPIGGVCEILYGDGTEAGKE